MGSIEKTHEIVKIFIHGNFFEQAAGYTSSNRLPFLELSCCFVDILEITVDDSSQEISQFAAFVIFFTYWSKTFKGSRNCPNRFGQFQNNFGPIEGQD